MSIEKKSLISTLKTTKKANVASSTPEAAHKMNKSVPKMHVKNAPKLYVKNAPKVTRA